MLDFEVAGHRYKAGNLPALQQVYIIRRIGPIVASILEGLARLPRPGEGENVVALRPDQDGNLGQLMEAMEPVMIAFAKLSDEDSKFIIDTSLAVVTREQEGGGWARIWEPRTGQCMFQDIEGIQMLAVTSYVLRDTLSRFSLAVQQLSPASKQGVTS